MKDFKKSNGFGNRDRGGNRFPKRDFGGRPSFGGRNDRGGDSRRPDMHQATCANCNKQCQVPFRPNGEKPVYCNDCFGNVRGDSKPNFEKRGFNDRGDRGNRENSFSKPQSEHRDTRIDDLKREITAMNIKLDRVMEMLKESTAKVSIQSETKKSAKKAEKTKTIVVKKKPASKKK